MRLETTPAAPSATALADWLLAQPLAIVLLVLFVLGVLYDRIFTRSAMEAERARTAAERSNAERERERAEKERERSDKLQETVDTLSAGLTTATDVSREGLEIAKLNTTLMQSIDAALQRKGSR